MIATAKDKILVLALIKSFEFRSLSTLGLPTQASRKF